MSRPPDADDPHLTAHRTRRNRRPDPPLHPETLAELDLVMDDVIEDRS